MLASIGSKFKYVLQKVKKSCIIAVYLTFILKDSHSDNFQSGLGSQYLRLYRYTQYTSQYLYIPFHTYHGIIISMMPRTTPYRTRTLLCICIQFQNHNIVTINWN